MEQKRKTTKIGEQRAKYQKIENKGIKNDKGSNKRTDRGGEYEINLKEKKWKAKERQQHKQQDIRDRNKEKQERE